MNKFNGCKKMRITTLTKKKIEYCTGRGVTYHESDAHIVIATHDNTRLPDFKDAPVCAAYIAPKTSPKMCLSPYINLMTGEFDNRRIENIWDIAH